MWIVNSPIIKCSTVRILSREQNLGFRNLADRPTLDLVPMGTPFVQKIFVSLSLKTQINLCLSRNVPGINEEFIGLKMIAQTDLAVIRALGKVAKHFLIVKTNSFVFSVSMIRELSFEIVGIDFRKAPNCLKHMNSLKLNDKN